MFKQILVVGKHDYQSPDCRDDSLPGWWILLELLLVPLVAHGSSYQLVDDNPEPNWNKVESIRS